MKILVIHNFHRSGSVSGDDFSADKEIKLLESYGHTIVKFVPSNDEFDGSSISKKVFIALQIPWSFISFKKIRKIIVKQNPDIIHIHNIFPLLSPSVYYAVQREKIPVIQNLHDYRLLCPRAFFLRGGEVCEECRKISFFKSIQYGCFQNSRIRTVPVALMLHLHHSLKTFQSKIDAYICLTNSQRSIFLDAGFEKEKLFVKPNFIEDTFIKEQYQTGRFALFFGRIGEEKGISTLIKAWKYLPDVLLKILGGGPDTEKFKSLAMGLNIKNLDFLGYKPHLECMKMVSSAMFLIAPSIWYETGIRTIIEAFSQSKPVIASHLGAMADLIEHGKTGLLFQPNNAEELASKVRWLWEHPEECYKMGINARKDYETKYTPEKNYEMLLDIYKEVLARK
jgi:glycosyltransferase involved in cell wall biosynthesis